MIGYGNSAGSGRSGIYTHEYVETGFAFASKEAAK